MKPPPLCGSSDDACRARYDRLLFASERCAAQNSNATTTRRRMLELGALTLLEAELGNMSMGGGGDRQRKQREQPTAERGYASCLKALVDQHYDNLRELV